MIHKSEADMEMDPDSPLNRAHQMERQAERMLSGGQYEQAVSWYEKAIEHLQIAIQQTKNPSAILSLKLQVENLKKQPQIVRKRQQWGRRKRETVSPLWNGHGQLPNGESADGSIKPELMSEDVADGDRGKEELLQNECRLRSDSTESRFNSFEEADSLLAMIRQHHTVEDKLPRYRVSQLLEAFKTLSLGKAGAEPALADDQSPSETSPEGKVSKTIVKELLSQNYELQSHLMQLFQVLDSCERENQKLKETVVDLTRQLEECRAYRPKVEDQFGMATDSRLEAPFSLIDGFACTPPTESLPPLSPLHLPNFEQVEDMS